MYENSLVVIIIIIMLPSEFTDTKTIKYIQKSGLKQIVYGCKSCNRTIVAYNKLSLFAVKQYEPLQENSDILREKIVGMSPE